MKHCLKTGLQRASCHLVALFAVPVVLAGSVDAAGLSLRYDQCFVRHYDEAHLSKHPAQAVRTISLAHRPSDYDEGQMQLASNPNGGEPTYFATLGIEIRGSGQAFSQSLECKGDDRDGWCGVECDGGRFAYSFKSNGSILVDFRQTGRMMLEGACEGAADGHHIGDPAGDDRLFRLDPVPLAMCPQ